MDLGLIRLLAVLLIAYCTTTAGAMVPGMFIHPVGTPVRCQIWHQVPGAQITDTLATDDLDKPASEKRVISAMEFAPDFKDEWACSLSALIIPPITGQYTFNIASRDSGLLFLSSDDSIANRKFIAETPAATDLHFYKAYSAQTSVPVMLTAGRQYFIQAVCKSGPGPGGVSIGWTLPGGEFQGPIPSNNFAAYDGDVLPPSLRVHQVTVSLKTDRPPTTQPGIQKFVRGAQVDVDGQQHDMSFLMDVPAAVSSTSEPLPMLVFLHGNNRQGYSLVPVEQIGPMLHIEADEKLRNWLPMILLCPQLPPEWRWDSPGAAQAVNALVEQLCRQNPRIDRTRIYLTGFSMGGKGTWLTLEDSPQRYAAVVPISAVDVRPDLAPEELKNLQYLHIVCGSNDNGFTAGSHRMYDALRPVLGNRLEFTVFEHEGHGVWDHLYSSRAFYERLLKYSNRDHKS